MPSLVAETVFLWFDMHPDHPILPEVQLSEGATFQGRPLTRPGQAMPSIISESLQQPRRPLASCNHNHASSSTWDRKTHAEWHESDQAVFPLSSIATSIFVIICTYYHQKLQPKPRKGSDETIWVMFLPSKFEVCSTLFTCNMSSTFGAL